MALCVWARCRWRCTPVSRCGSRYHWDNFYHVAGIEREVAHEIWAKRSEKEMFDCLAWLYDGFAMPQSASHEKVNPLPRSDNN